MPYQQLRALTPIRHSGVLRIPGQSSGPNAQDFVAEDTQAERLVAAGYVISLGAAPTPESVLPIERFGVVVDPQNRAQRLRDLSGGPDVSLSASGGMTYFRDRIRQGASKVRPFMAQRHIVDYPAWANNMVVKNGTTVKSTVGGVVQLFAWLGTGGNSTTQPTVMSTWKPQADAGIAGSGSDTRGWIYIGPDRRDTRMAADIASYTYLFNSGPGATLTYGAWAANSPLRSFGAIENLSNDSWVKVQVGDSIECRSGWKQKDGTQTAGNGSIAFYTDADLVAWQMNPNGTTTDSAFEVDDVPWSLTPLDIGTNRVRVIQFNSYRRRLIRINNVGEIMSNIYLRAGTQLEPATDLLNQRVLWVGDSYHGGAAPGPLALSGHIPNHVARNLGLGYFHNPSIGGRGFEFNGGNAAANSLTEMLELDATKHAESKYMAVFFCMSGNDTGRPAADVRSSYVRALRVARASTRFTDSPIFVCTRFNGAGSTEAADMNALMDQAIAEVADSNIYLIKMGTDRSTGGALLNSSNQAIHIGTSDIHPFDGGHRLYADYVSDQVLRIMGLS